MSRDWTQRLFEERPGALAITCAGCSRTFWIPQSKAGQRSRCSAECVAKRPRGVRVLPWEKRLLEPRSSAVSQECIVCGATFWLPKSKIKERRTCSAACAAARPQLARSARARRCEACGVTFIPRGVQVAKGGGRFCSQACNGAARFVEFTGIRRQRRGKLPRSTVPRLLAAQKRRCAICRSPLGSKFHRDHIIPIVRGGRHVPANVQLLCPSCNIAKGGKDPIEHMQSLGRLL